MQACIEKLSTMQKVIVVATGMKDLPVTGHPWASATVAGSKAHVMYTPCMATLQVRSMHQGSGRGSMHQGSGAEGAGKAPRHPHTRSCPLTGRSSL